MAVLERAKTVRALDRSATAISSDNKVRRIFVLTELKSLDVGLMNEM
jgi:hypothetical protein